MEKTEHIQDLPSWHLPLQAPAQPDAASWATAPTNPVPFLRLSTQPLLSIFKGELFSLWKATQPKS